MKKSLLFLSLVAMAGVASAQVVEATKESLEAAGIVGADVEGGVVFAENPEVGTLAVAFKDSWKSTSTYKGYRNVKVGDYEVTLGSGAVGSANPTFISYEDGAPSAGAVFKITVKKNGFVTVFTKINPNKQYVACEDLGKDGGVAYTLGMTNGTDKIHYALPAQKEGEFTGFIDFESPEASKYFVVATKQSRNEAGVLLWQRNDTQEIVAADKKPEVEEGGTYKWNPLMEEVPGQNKPQFPYLVSNAVCGTDWAKAPGEGTGFITFSVVAEEEYPTDYYVSALGSKAAVGTFVFTETNPTVTFQAYADEDGTEHPEVVFPAMNIGDAAVDAVEAVDNANAPVYNLMGVRVNADAKGILIKNGKKFIRK